METRHSSGRVSVSIVQSESSSSSSSSPSPPYLPGCTIDARLQISSEVQYTTVDLRLIGSWTSNIMGKERWQAATVMSAGSGNPAVLIQSRETHQFCNLIGHLEGEKSEGISVGEGSVVQNGVYRFQVPETFQAPDDHGPEWLLPSITSKLEAQGNSGPGITVEYALEFVGKRKGFMKSKDQLKLKLPFVALTPQSVPQYNNVESSWPCTTSERPLKFQGKQGTSVPSITATLSYQPSPLTASYIPIFLTLQAPPASPNLLSTLSDAKEPTFSLSKSSRTTPIDNPGNGREFQWAYLRVGLGFLVNQSRSGDYWRYEAGLKIPEGERTLFSIGVETSYNITAHLICSSLANPIVLSVPVFIPSTDQRQGGQHRAMRSQRLQEEEEPLPLYQKE